MISPGARALDEINLLSQSFVLGGGRPQDGERRFPPTPIAPIPGGLDHRPVRARKTETHFSLRFNTLILARPSAASDPIHDIFFGVSAF